MTTDRLYEFSTGIRPQRSADGGWVSLGFTGQYMNVTGSIPNPIQRSIANKEFAVAEGASSEQPGIIGRVVQGSDNCWSVVALVSRGWDEKGRSASFYRYLWCEGDKGLPKILAWIDEYKREHGGNLPIFDPFVEVVADNTYLSHQLTGKPPARELSTDSVPILLAPSQRYPLEDIHVLASVKASGQPVSWAYNVEALEQPWRFVVIQAASDRAYELLQRAIANPPKVPKPVVADEQALRSAIKSLIGSSTVKREAVEEIVTAIDNQEISEGYWHSLFDSQGARNALSQKMSSPQMIRLLTLRTLVIPATLPQYLDWLAVNDNLKKRNFNQAITGSLEFQSKLRPNLVGYPQITQQITSLVEQVIKAKIPANFWERIGDYIQGNVSNSHLAKLYYKLATLCEQCYRGKVDEKLFEKAFGNDNVAQPKIFVVTIKKELVNLQAAILIAITCFFVGGAGGYFLRDRIASSLSNSANAPSPENTQIPGQNTPPLQDEPEEEIPSQNGENKEIDIPKDINSKAIEKFASTVTAMDEIVTEVKSSQTKSQDEVVIAIKNVLENKGQFTLDWGVIDGSLSSEPEKYQPDQKQWILAIYAYQQRKGSKVTDGYISPGGGTAKSLKEDIIKSLKDVPDGS